MKRTRLTGAASILIICAALVCLNFIASRIDLKLDLTRDSLYTLTAGTRAIAAGIEDEAVIQYFFSRSDETLPVMLKDYGRRVQELLAEVAALSPRLRLEVYDPRPDSDEEEMAVRYGIHGAQTGDGTAFFMGAALQFQDKTFTIPLFDPRREAFLEYDIASMLARTRETAAGRKVLGLLSGMALTSKEFTQPLMMQQASAEDWLFVQELERTFDTQTLSVGLEEIPADIDVLLVLHPLAVTEKTEYAIEQYILRGGKAALVVDPSARSVPDTAQAGQYGRGTGSRSNLPNVFKTIGVSYDDQRIAADRRYSTRVGSGSGPVQYPFWLSLDSSSFNRDQIITALLESMLLIEPGFFKPLPGASVELTPLLSTSASPGTISASQLALVTPQNVDRYQPAEGPLALAALATGRFSSSFAGKPEGSQYARDHRAQADRDTAVLLIGDVDFINNSYSLRNLSFLGQNIIQPLNHNLAFLTNALEFLTGSTELISIRSRGSFQRPFERVADIEKQAQAKWHGVEQELTDKIQELQRSLNQLQSAGSQDNQVALSAAQQAEIDKFKIEQLEFKRKRREVRKNLRQDIERLGTILAVLNITVVPSLVLLAGLYIYFRRAGGRPLLAKRRSA